MASQFIRKASLVIGDSTDGIDLSNLQFKFQVKMADITHPQYATFRVYNVAKQTMAAIKSHEYRRVVLSAGYQEGNYGTIFDGEVIQGSSGRESAVDTYIDLLAAAGYSANQATISQTLAAGSTPGDAAQAAASAMGMPLNDHTAGAGFTYPRGKVMYGMARDILTKSANAADGSWFYDGGAIQIVDGETYVPGAPLVLNANTGMVGWPEQTQDGIKVRCLLNPLISVATRLRIDNASIQRAQISADVKYVNVLPGIDADGVYRILYFEHHGDTRGNDWYTDIIGISINETSDGGISALYQKGLL